MAPLPPNHNTPGHPPFRYFPPRSGLSQVLLVLAVAIAFVDFQNMARAKRPRADYKNRFLVSYRKKGTRAPALRFVLLLRFEGVTPPRQRAYVHNVFYIYMASYPIVGDNSICNRTAFNTANLDTTKIDINYLKTVLEDNKESFKTRVIKSLDVYTVRINDESFPGESILKITINKVDIV